MNTPSVLFVDVNSLKLLQAWLPQLDVYSENVKSLDFISSTLSTCVTFDISCRAYIPLPPMQFTRHHLKLSVKEASLQPLMLESGFLSFGSSLLAERNPANEHLPSFSLLQRRSLPGLRLPWWPWKPHSWRHVPGSRRSKRPPRFFNAAAHLLSSFNNPNWYHWLTLPGLGSLPVSHQADEMLLSDRSISVEPHPNPPLLKRVGSLAGDLFPDSKLIYDRGPILYKQLEACFIENHTSLVCDPNGLNRLRCAGRQLISRAHGKIDSDRIYLRRGLHSSRPLDEELRLEHALQIRGFVVIDAAALPLELCISIFASASWVVAPHGAALTNLVFASPGTKVLELLPGSLDTYGHYALISAALGLQHHIWRGHSNSSGGFEINQTQMLSWLDTEISASLQ